MPKISLKTGKAVRTPLPENHNPNLFKYIRRLACFFALILTGCQGITPTVQPILISKIWQIQLTPALKWLEPGLNLCTNRQVSLGLATFERPAAELGNHTADITLRWGAPDHLTGYAVVLAYDELVLAVNAHNPIQSLSQKDVRAIYSGKVNDWNSFSQSASFDQPIQPWSYADGEETQQVFINALVQDYQNSAAVGFAPAPEAMRQVLAANAGAVGSIPQHWLDQSIRKVNLTDATASLLRVPILAITSSEPTAQQKLWLECLQSTLKP